MEHLIFNNDEELISISYNLELINKMAKNEPNKLVKISEQLYHRQISIVVSEILENKCRLVFVAGPSSAGKTTSSKLIKKGLKEKGKKSIVVSMDDFFVEESRIPLFPNGEEDLENVENIDIPVFKKFIEDLLSVGKGKLPRYDFYKNKCSGYENVSIEKTDIIIVEGLHALNPMFTTKKMGKVYKVYIAVNSNFIIGKNVVISCKQLRFMRRMLRDYYFRGDSLETTLQRWPKVRQGEKKYIIPYKNTANYVVNTVHPYEPLLYDNYLKPLLETLNKHEKIKEISEIFNKTSKLDNIIVPKNSLLWEFIPKK